MEGTVPSGLVTARLDRYSLRDRGAALIPIVSPSCRFFTIHGLITSFLLHTFFEIVHGMACFRQSGVSEGLGTRAAVCASLPEMIQNTFFELVRYLVGFKQELDACVSRLPAIPQPFLSFGCDIVFSIGLGGCIDVLHLGFLLLVSIVTYK